MGIISVPAIEQITGDLNALIGNLVPETIGIIFTVLILNRAADNRAKEEIKQHLLEDLKSTSVSPAVNALDRLRREGWLPKNYFNSEKGNKLRRVNWEGAYIGGLNFEGAKLTNVNFKNVSITDNSVEDDYKIVIFNNANLSKAQFQDAYLYKAQFQEATLSQANLQRAMLSQANLQGAILSQANLQRTNLILANLEGALLVDTQLQNANLRRTSLEGAILIGATLDGAIWCVFGDITPNLPDGTFWKPGDDLERFTNPEHTDFEATLEKINIIREKQGRVPIWV